MPYHLAVHKVVADVAPHESSGRNEPHAQQSVRRSSVSAKKKHSELSFATLPGQVVIAGGARVKGGGG